MRSICPLRISALEKPLSTIEFDTAMNIAIIAMTPYSAGVSKRAKMRPIRNVTPELAILSIKLQATPRTVLRFKDSCIQ